MDNKPLLVGVAALAALGLASLFFYLKKSYNTDSISVKLTV